MALAAGFDSSTDVGLLSEILECLRISDSQQDTDFRVFFEANAKCVIHTLTRHCPDAHGRTELLRY